MNGLDDYSKIINNIDAQVQFKSCPNEHSYTLSYQPSHLPPLPSLRDVLRIYGLRAQKQLSQNFLLQPASINGLVKCAGRLKNAYVLEVGPGPGGLTRAILECRPRHVAVVELDRRFLPGLEQLRLAAAEMDICMDIYRQDILQLNTDNLFPPEAYPAEMQWNRPTVPPEPSRAELRVPLANSEPPSRGVHIIGNLPFNISTPLLVRWLHDIAERRGIWRHGPVPLTLTFQKEVGERIVADVWDDQRSRLSVMAQAFCEVRYLKEIPGSAFLPIPKVDAAVVQLVPRNQPIIPVSFPYVEKVIRSAFQFRRKQVVRGLETLFPANRPDLVIQLFREAGVQPVKRPTQLTNLEFRDLCEVYQRICHREGGMFEFSYVARENLPMWYRRKAIQREILGTEKALGAETVQKYVFTQ